MEKNVINNANANNQSQQEYFNNLDLADNIYELPSKILKHKLHGTPIWLPCPFKILDPQSSTSCSIRELVWKADHIMYY